jgi:hypothetical protein
MNSSGIRDREPYEIDDDEIGRAVAAQLVLVLQNVDVDDLLDIAMIEFAHHPTDPTKVTLMVSLSKIITHGEYLNIGFPYPLLGMARRVAAAPPGVRAEYRRQWEKHPVGIGATIPIHPDTVDLWAAEIEKARKP